MSKTAKKTKATETRATRKAAKRDFPIKPLKRSKKAEVVQLPAPADAPIKGSVVGQAYKDKAGKSGVWKEDAVSAAVREAFLSETTTDVPAAEAARIATDKILVENGLDSGRWEGKNPGMLSMNLRNVLRGLIRNNEWCIVYGATVA